VLEVIQVHHGSFMSYGCSAQVSKRGEDWRIWLPACQAVVAGH
jgi:hypothetical protein